MKIITIEPTPSPNSMKVIVDQELPFGESFNYTKDNMDSAPSIIQQVLAIEGVKGIYHVADFLAIERNAKIRWEAILAEIRNVFGENLQSEQAKQINEHYGEVYVHVQNYKDIPLQVKVFDSENEVRLGLSERFIEALNEAMVGDEENYILQRKWADYGVRYGEKEEIAAEMKAEIEAAFPQERLQRFIEQAQSKKELPTREAKKVSLELFDETNDWESRFQLLDQMADPEVDDLPMLSKALEDEKMSIRRLATVYLGMIDDEQVVPYLEKALQDKSAAVRRTAGDCMSDLGFPQFESAMIQSLQDKNKLVRWRAAMFLYETGTEKSLPALKEAANDLEFEVKLQAQMAIARIEQGEEAKGSVWKQMTERNN